MRAFIWWVYLTLSASGHVVTQISAEWISDEPWEIEVLFDAGYAVPEWRGDAQSPAPAREWLAALGEAGWAPLRHEAERYLRECMQVRSAGRAQEWQVRFIDFEKTPPDFPTLLNDGAYFRMRIIGREALESGAEIRWNEGSRPTFVMKLPGRESGYVSLAAGQTAPLPVTGIATQGRAPWLESFRQGFLHVLPLGLDHMLFVMGLFFYQRAWRPLLTQSLAFTLAHTVTLGLAAAGMVKISGGWVEPAIALSLIVVALENLRSAKSGSAPMRLGIVFGFGLIHGFGFAGALSSWIAPGEGFLAALLAANLGVEIAQAALLAAAWGMTVGWHNRPIYQRVRFCSCVVIAGFGAYWGLVRTGWLGSPG